MSDEVSARGGSSTRPEEETLSRGFRALGHPHRLTIVRALMERAFECCAGERADDCALDPASCNVGDLARLVDIAPSTVSHHLKELEIAGIIERARDGRYLYCRVNEPLLARLAVFLAGEPAGAGARRPAGSVRSDTAGAAS